MSKPSSSLDLSLVLACYREEGHLLTNIGKIHEYLGHTTLSYEVVFVEDCSPDGTVKEVLKSKEWLEAKGIPVQTIFHKQNVGRGGTVQEGMGVAKGKVIAYIDVDLENLIDGLLPMVLAILRGEADVVVAKRYYQSAQVKFIRWFLSIAYKALVHMILPLPVSDTEAGMKAFSNAKIQPVLPLVKNRAWFWDTEVVVRSMRAGLRVAEHPIIFVRNPQKASTVNALRDSLIYLRDLWALVKEAPVTPTVMPSRAEGKATGISGDPHRLRSAVPGDDRV